MLSIPAGLPWRLSPGRSRESRASGRTSSLYWAAAVCARQPRSLGKKDPFTSVDFGMNLCFLSKHQNRPLGLLLLTIPNISPSWVVSLSRFTSFLLYLYFGCIFKKILVNHIKFIKRKIQFCWTSNQKIYVLDILYTIFCYKVLLWL